MVEPRFFTAGEQAVISGCSKHRDKHAHLW
ncbi:hypothetical protein SPV1_08606 [Mariprofundus ferrooxydans PV-1]|uniref:Uncharacterized protein n=1 Tax=Mariprofundus ferrooxydans PV-1 TaxID=314345 RepID=Q0EYU2_9PROT|nr:hypothetical protein SPV1_08606 [Mariprofundus ferrooxydans PV-1]